MYLDVPVSMFDIAFRAGGYNSGAEKNGAFIYLYSKFGSNPYTNNDGFEEWAFLGQERPVEGGNGGFRTPEPGSMALAAIALLGAGTARRRLRT